MEDEVYWIIRWEVNTLGNTVVVSVCCVFEQKCQSLHHHIKMSQWLDTCKCCLRGRCHCQRHRQAATPCTVHRNSSQHTPTPAAPRSIVSQSNWTAPCSVAGQCRRPLQVSVATARCISSTHTVRHCSISAQIWARPCPTSRWCHRAMIFVNQQGDKAAYMVRNVCSAYFVWSLLGVVSNLLEKTKNISSIFCTCYLSGICINITVVKLPCLAIFVDAYVSIQNAHSYSPQLYSTLTSDAALLKVRAEEIFAVSVFKSFAYSDSLYNELIKKKNLGLEFLFRMSNNIYMSI